MGKNKRPKAAKPPTLTQQVFRQAPRVELLGNQQVLVEGCGGILDYQEDWVCLRAGRMRIQLRGRDLQLDCLSESSLVIRGEILTLEYGN